MKKGRLYGILLLCLLLSFVYDKQIALMVTQSRMSLLNGFMVWLTNPLTFITIFLLMTTLFLLEERKRGWIIPLWATIFITAAVTMLTKLVISRTRPFEALALPTILGADYTFASWNTSFPSLHAAAVFSLVPILDKEFPKLTWFWITLALLISLSRVYLGVHYLSDVLAGCLIGLLTGYGLLHVEKRYNPLKKWVKKKN